MLGSTTNAGFFLLNTLFDIYIFVIMLRIILQWAGVSYYNPISQFVVKATNPIVLLLRRFLPKIAYIDLASVVLLFAIVCIKLFILIALFGYLGLTIPGLFIFAVIEILQKTINIFFYAILISVILSWVNPGLQSPLTEILFRVTEPLLGPVRRIIPPLGGFDLSTLVVLIALQMISILI